MELPDLPIGIQYFDELREQNYLYIDKTEFVYKIMHKGGPFFLSRPRRFGKSLFLHTISMVAEGRRDLFKNTWIEDKWDWSLKYPVLHFKFADMDFQEWGLKEAIFRDLQAKCAHFGITPKSESIRDIFKQLLHEVAEKEGKIVLLIDEYDKPIIEYLESETMERAYENQKIIKNFYGCLKDASNCLHIVFITGISKFVRVSLFSELNHLSDLTLDRRFTTAFGYTQTEVEAHFEPHIQDFLIENPEFTRKTLLEKVKLWYNGYSWDAKTTVYNPFGLLSFFDKGQFFNFWFATGTPTFLLKKMFNDDVFECEGMEVDPLFIDQYSLDNIEFTSLLFQTGYLTIKAVTEEGNYILGYPNKEVSDSMYRFILTKFKHKGDGGVTMQHLAKYFRQNDLEKVQYLLKNVFNTLPYDVYKASNEALYHGLVHILFQYMGLNIESEVHTKFGRLDAVVQTATHVFIFEFKFNKTSEAAMEQLKKRDYAAKFRASGKKIVGIGLNFTEKNRAIDEWVVENL
jgi:Predicted AAA-ATPase/PD-(D/E)XK nuclease superfamily